MKAKEKGMRVDNMDGWHRGFRGHKFEQILGDGKGEGSLKSMGSQRVGQNLVTEQKQC